MNKRTYYIILIVLVSYFAFIFGKKKEMDPKPSLVQYVAPDSIYHNIDDIYNEKRANDLDKRFARLNKKGLFNGTVIYIENGEEVFKGAYGYADFRKKEKMDTHDSFQLASVSKMFTATAIMILKEQGKLDIDDTITKFIPEFPYYGISLRLLMNHRSGLSRYMSLADKYWDPHNPINNEEVVALFVKYKPNPYFKPNNGFHYCNTNYALLASVVERVSGQPFDEFVKQNIFKPLGMDDSFVYNLKGDSLVPATITVGVPGYKYGGRYARKMGNYYLNGVMGDKGVYSSVEDLFKFNEALDNGNLVSQTLLEEAFSPGSPRHRGRKDNYGFGWRIKDGMDSTVYHFGWWKGFRTYFLRDMENDRAIIALTNTHKGLSSQVFWDIINEKNKTKDLLEIYSKLD
jgi:CubicO group peptidase (beta-lactamase class C family)